MTMTIPTLRASLSILAFSAFLSAVPSVASAPAQADPSYIQATGVVTQVTPTAIALKTPYALVSLNVNAMVRSGFAHVKVGDELTVWLNGDNVVVDVHTSGHATKHRFISGNLAYSDPNKSEISLWTPEGVQRFPLKREDARLQQIPEGTPITLEIDESGRLTELHRN
ncbi:MAG TPA: hypothetical protein VFA38_05875 [Nitrospirales bacterium]|nr:hypothetical protein [Nitrospirales bacterium]